MLLDVLTRLAADTGLDPVGQRNTIVNVLNHAAKEIFTKLECNKVYWEVTLSVPPNKLVSLPSFIGELRGMARSPTNEMMVPYYPIGAPRYVRSDVSYKWKNWRDLGENPIMQFPSVVGPLSISAAEVETVPITLYINGQTNKALRIEEQVLINATDKVTTNLFGPQIYSIACASSQERTVDINISDANGLLLAVLYNMDTTTRYKMVDVSEAPWSQDLSDGNSLIDVMYKVQLRRLTKDSDNFPGGPDFDLSWYWMAMHLYFKPMKKKPSDFENFYAYAITSAKAAKESGEDSLEKKISFGRNKYFSLTRGYYYCESYTPCTS